MPGKRITDQQMRRYMDLRSKHDQATAAAKAAISVASARRIEGDPRLPSQKKSPRHWRTREDPLAAVWESEIIPLLEQAPGLRPITVLHELQRRYPDVYEDNVRRTLERRICQWRALKGPEKVVMFPQAPVAGQVAQSDFSHMDDVGVTIAGATFDHMIYHLALPFSGFEHVEPVIGGESFVALAGGLQNALTLLGGAPKEHRTDSLSAAFRNLDPDAAEDQTRRYEALLAHYGMTPTRNNRGVAHENGSIESRHGHAKDRVKQALMLRGHADFADLDAYRMFIGELVAAHNARRLRPIEFERSLLQPLPTSRAMDWEETTVRVTTHSGFSFRRVFYTVPSRLIGRRLRLRAFADRIEAFLGAVCVLSLRRERPPAGRRAHVVDYRHVIASLKVKPGALIGLIYRDALWPRPAYRRAFEALLRATTPRRACRIAVGLLALAHERACEADLAVELDALLDAGDLPDLEDLGRRFSSPVSPMAPAVRVLMPPASSYDALINSDRLTETCR